MDYFLFQKKDHAPKAVLIPFDDFDFFYLLGNSQFPIGVLDRPKQRNDENYR